MIAPHEVDKILAARVQAGVRDADDWAAAIRAKQAPVRSGVLGLLDHATDGPRRLEAAIGSALAGGVALLWLGWALGRR